MNLESQVCSFDLAMKLKEIGIKQESYFKYEYREDGYREIYHNKSTSCAHQYCSAFTAQELWEMIDNCNFYSAN